jgi:glycosyltransferase involved in cell wall biosynthesis
MPKDCDVDRVNRSACELTGTKSAREWSGLTGKRAAAVMFSHYPSDPRPRRAAEALVQMGMKVEVICLAQDGDETRRDTFNGVEILRLPMKRRRGGKAAYLFQYGWFILLACLRLTVRSFTRRYSLVHIHNMPDVLVFCALVPKLFGARVILDLHDPMPELMMTIFNLRWKSFSVRLLKFLEKCSLAFADKALTVNLACKRIFSERSCAPGKIHVVMNSPDEDIFQLSPVPENHAVSRDISKPFVIMYHGSLVKRLGLDLAVTALGKVRSRIPRTELRIYGRTTPYLQQVMEQARKEGLSDCIRHMGGKTLEQIAREIDECDVGVIPNRKSLFTEIATPTRIFEYLSRGRPVIGPRAVGVEDYFSDKDILLFEPGNADELAEKIEYVFQNPTKVAAMARSGQSIYSEHKWSREKQRFLNLVAGFWKNGTGIEPIGRAAGIRQP